MCIRDRIYETWEDIPATLVAAAKSRQHDWPERGQSHRNWIEVSGERLIQVVLPLFGSDDSLAGYVEGVSPVSYTHLRAHETVLDLVCRLLLEKKKKIQLDHFSN